MFLLYKQEHNNGWKHVTDQEKSGEFGTQIQPRKQILDFLKWNWHFPHNWRFTNTGSREDFFTVYKLFFVNRKTLIFSRSVTRPRLLLDAARILCTLSNKRHSDPDTLGFYSHTHTLVHKHTRGQCTSVGVSDWLKAAKHFSLKVTKNQDKRCTYDGREKTESLSSTWGELIFVSVPLLTPEGS